jgi:hypothetical protein
MLLFNRLIILLMIPDAAVVVFNSFIWVPAFILVFVEGNHG